MNQDTEQPTLIGNDCAATCVWAICPDTILLDSGFTTVTCDEDDGAVKASKRRVDMSTNKIN